MSPSKRGLCWPTTNTEPVFPFTKPSSKISWLYNWSGDATPDSSSLDFVPMQWNTVNISHLPSKLHPATQSTTVLGFNEPELDSQSNIEPAVAAQHWLEHIAPLRRREEGSSKIRCGSPAISSSPDGIKWLQEFLRLIRANGESDVDFLCLHWYGETLGQLYDHIWSARWQLDETKPVWITEFACTNWNTQKPLPTEYVEGFAREACGYLDGVEWVERYAWFAPMRDCGSVGVGARMLDDDGQLTRLGREYRDG